MRRQGHRQLGVPAYKHGERKARIGLGKNHLAHHEGEGGRFTGHTTRHKNDQERENHEVVLGKRSGNKLPRTLREKVCKVYGRGAG